MATVGHNRKMLGAECMADMLEAYGVTHVFHVPAVLRKTFAVMETRTKIKRLHVHSEATAAYMADGYARATGKPGICMAQVIGALNLAAGLRDAWLAHSPVIAFTGGREPKTKFRQVYQEVDDVPAFEPVTKMNATVDDVTRFPDMVRQAFRVATTGRPGPVHLQFRGNEGQVDGDEGEMEPMVEPEFSHIPPFRPEPDQASVMKALQVLQSATKPVIVAGAVSSTPARAANWLRSPRRCRFRSSHRSTARTRSRACIRCRAVWSAHTLARAPTRSSTRPISSASSARRRAA